MYATEGMRTLRDNDEDAAELIISRCNKILDSPSVCPFELNECRIISGGLEAIGAWIDANIQCKDIDMIGKYGVVEIGGASVQIVGDVNNKVSLKGWGKDEIAKRLWSIVAPEHCTKCDAIVAPDQRDAKQCPECGHTDETDSWYKGLDMYNDVAKAKSLKKFYEDNPLWNGGETGCWDDLIQRLRRVCRYDLNSAIVQVDWPEEKRPYKLAGIFKILEKYFEIDTKKPYFEQVKDKGKKEFCTAVSARSKSDKYGNEKHMPFSAALVTYLHEVFKFGDHMTDDGTDAQCDVEWVRGLANMMPEFDFNGDKEFNDEEVNAIFECAKIQKKMEAAARRAIN